MYAGGKAALRPLHDAIIAGALERCSDLKICPCQTIVPLYRKHVVAQIKPAARSRIDFGLALAGARRKPPQRILATGGLEKGDRITHRIPVSRPSDLDDQLWRWFDIACKLDG